MSGAPISASVVVKARFFAIAAHEAAGQTRKFTNNEPYWVHPQAVATLLSRVPGRTEAMICAGWLHDVLEDTQVRMVTLRAEFGPEIFELVTWVTKDASTRGLPRAARLQRDIQKMFSAPAEAKTVKLADIVDNCSTIVERAPPDYASTYLRDKLAMLEALREGDRELWRCADELIRRGLGA